MGTLQCRITDFISIEASPVRSTTMGATAPATYETDEQNVRFEDIMNEQKDGGGKDKKIENITEEGK